MKEQLIDIYTIKDSEIISENGIVYRSLCDNGLVTYAFGDGVSKLSNLRWITSDAVAYFKKYLFG